MRVLDLDALSPVMDVTSTDVPGCSGLPEQGVAEQDDWCAFSEMDEDWVSRRWFNDEFTGRTVEGA